MPLTACSSVGTSRMQLWSLRHKIPNQPLREKTFLVFHKFSIDRGLWRREKRIKYRIYLGKESRQDCRRWASDLPMLSIWHATRGDAIPSRPNMQPRGMSSRLVDGVAAIGSILAVCPAGRQTAGTERSSVGIGIEAIDNSEKTCERCVGQWIRSGPRRMLRWLFCG